MIFSKNSRFSLDFQAFFRILIVRGDPYDKTETILWQMMKDNPHIEKVYLCLDNDKPGQQAAERIIGKLVEKGIPSEILTPTLKDWNEDLLFTEQEEKPCQTLQL